MNNISRLSILFAATLHVSFSIAQEAVPDNAENSDSDFFSRVIDSTGKILDDFTGSEESEVAVDEFPQVWQGTYDKLDKILVLQDRHEDLPESSWFKEDQASNQKKIDALMQTAIDILGISNARNNLEAIKEYEGKIREARNQIGRYQTEKIGKPGEAADYNAKISEAQESIKQYQAAIGDRKQAITEEMQAMGLTIDVSQLEALMSSVNGDDMVEMSVVFNNVKSVSNQLSDLMQSNGDNLEFARKHYGMYTLLLHLLITMQDNFIIQVKEHYLPKLNKISADAQQLTEETRQVMNVEFDPTRRSQLQSSLQSQQLTIRTAQLYKKRLLSDIQQVQAAQDMLQKDLTVAQIRYKTVSISGDLVDMIRSGNNQFAALANLQMPDLVPFEDLQLKTEFEKLTRELEALEE